MWGWMLTFGNIVRHHADNDADKPAVIFRDRVSTYGELNARANRLANALLAQGYAKGDKVAVLMKNHRAYIEIIVGLAKIGVIAVPINYRLVYSEVEYIVRNSECRGFVAASDYLDIAERLHRQGPQLDLLLVVDLANAADGLTPYESFISGQSALEPAANIHEHDALYLGYTSGTTGKPKGVVISHRSRMLTGMAAAYEYRIDASDVQLIAAPIYHAAPWIFLMMQLIVGGTLVIQESFVPESFYQGVEKYRVTNAFLPPTLFNLLVNVKEEERGGYDVGSMRVFISAGSPLPTKTKQDILTVFPQCDLHEFYGSTESAITLNIKPQDIRRKERSVGKPFPFVECLLLDENKRPVAAGEVGELYIKAPYLLDGYYNNDKANEESFHGDFFTVGDMALRDEEGFYYIVDRKKDMLISGGINIYPREIEEVLFHHPDLLDAAVIGVPDPVWGEAVKAIVVPREGASPTEESVIRFCEGKLAGYKKPKSVDFVQSLPRNPSGKLLKRELRDQYWRDQQTRI